MTDKDLRDRVMAELKWTPSVNEAHIGVSAKDGVVTLSGHVESYVEKYEAERAVQRVRGVRAVVEEIDVHLPFDRKTTDEEIARRVLDILAYDTQVPRDAIKVKVTHGHVTLSGVVHWQFQRAAAEWGVRRLAGVSGVSNLIQLKPPVSAVDVRAQIENALKRNATLMAAGIDVKVDGGKVILDGKVRSFADRSAAEQAAWAAPGVTQVVDHIHLS